MKMCNEKKSAEMQHNEDARTRSMLLHIQSDLVRTRTTLSIHSRERAHTIGKVSPVQAKLLSRNSLFLILEKGFCIHGYGYASAGKTVCSKALKSRPLNTDISAGSANRSALPTFQNNHIRAAAAAGLPTVTSENFSAYRDSPPIL